MLRRGFIQATAAVGALALAPACWVGGGYDAITHYVPVALLAFERILDILVEHGVPTERLSHMVALVKAAFADILAAIEEFRHRRGRAQDTLVAAIRTALEIAQKRLDEFWGMLELKDDQLLHTLKLLLDVIKSTLAGFEQRLPPGPSGMHYLPPEPIRTEKEFRETFNLVLRQHGEGKYAI